MAARAVQPVIVPVDHRRTARPTSDWSGQVRVLPGVSVLSGKADGQDLSLSILTEKDVNLVGTVRGAQGSLLFLEDNVRAIAQTYARKESELLEVIDAEIARRGLVVPERVHVRVFDTLLFSDYGDKLDLVANNITTIIWATGFVLEYRILLDTALDESSVPLNCKGIGTMLDADLLTATIRRTLGEAGGGRCRRTRAVALRPAEPSAERRGVGRVPREDPGTGPDRSRCRYGRATRPRVAGRLPAVPRSGRARRRPAQQDSRAT